MRKMKIATSLGALAHLKMPPLDQKLVMAYTETDLRRVCEQMERAYWYADALYMLASARPAARRQIRSLLLQKPEIRQALEKRRRPPAKLKKNAT
jgi:hypothetical protein